MIEESPEARSEFNRSEAEAQGDGGQGPGGRGHASPGQARAVACKEAGVRGIGRG